MTIYSLPHHHSHSIIDYISNTEYFAAATQVCMYICRYGGYWLGTTAREHTPTDTYIPTILPTYTHSTYNTYI